ncbi:MAG TPA: uroporphyrinogen decarboxylase family protein [Bacillota bacterium]|nr:uroporphyrinogen decarboxylase family protein [Bacillota bacterium]
MSFNTKQWLDSLIGDKPAGALPILSFPCVQLLGISVRELIFSDTYQVRGMKAVADRTPSLASVSLMDLSVEAEAFGSDVRFFDHEIPCVTGRIVTTEEEADALRIPEPGAGRTEIYLRAARKALQVIRDRPVLAGIIGPFSLAGRLVDVTEAMILCYENPELIKKVLDKAASFLIAYARAYKREGVHGVIMAEPLAGLLSPALAHEFSEPYVRRIVDAVQDDGFVVVYHNCGGSTVRMPDSILATGCGAYHFGNAVSMREILKYFPRDTVVMGNVDPAAQFVGGTPEGIRAETRRIMEECHDYRNFVISSGCDIPPHAKWENIDAFFEAVAGFSSGGAAGAPE